MGWHETDVVVSIWSPWRSIIKCKSIDLEGTTSNGEMFWACSCWGASYPFPSLVGEPAANSNSGRISSSLNSSIIFRYGSCCAGSPISSEVCSRLEGVHPAAWRGDFGRGECTLDLKTYISPKYHWAGSWVESRHISWGYATNFLLSNRINIFIKNNMSWYKDTSCEFMQAMITLAGITIFHKNTWQELLVKFIYI